MVPRPFDRRTRRSYMVGPTIDLRRVTALELGGRQQVISDPGIRAEVRATLARHLGLDLPPVVDGAG